MDWLLTDKEIAGACLGAALPANGIAQAQLRKVVTKLGKTDLAVFFEAWQQLRKEAGLE